MTDLLSIGLNERFLEEKSNIRSYIADPGVVTTNIMNDGMHWLMRYVLMIPVIFIVSYTFVKFRVYSSLLFTY